MLARRAKTPPRFGAIVLGLHLNGLGVVHHLVRHRIPLVALDDRPRQLGFSSRYGPKRVCPNPERQSGELRNSLLALAGELPWRGVLIPTNDEFALFMSRERAALQPHFEFALPAGEVVEALFDKWSFDDLRRRHGLPGPRTVCPRSEADLASLRDHLVFPCVVKPIRTSLWKGTGKGKAVYAGSFTDLQEAWRRLSGGGDDLLVQEMIPGGDHHAYLYFAYYDRRARPLVEFTMRKIRQHPPRFGTACLAEVVDAPDVIARSRAFLHGIGYQGLVDVEFVRDARDGELKVIEVNPRIGLQHALGARAGADLILTAFRDATGGEAPGGDSQRCAASAAGRKLKWMEVSRDLESAGHDLAAGAISLGEWRDSLRGDRTYASWNWRDPLPFLRTLRWQTILSIGRILKIALGGRRARRAPSAIGETPAVAAHDSAGRA